MLIRVDFNVPLDADGNITSDRRIQAEMPTIQHCLNNDAKLVLISHLGGPGGESDPKLSLNPAARYLEQLLQSEESDASSVRLVEEYDNWSSGDQGPEEIILRENLRFRSGEKSGDDTFAPQLRQLGDIYVNDAFANCHRKHASMFAVPELFPEATRAIGLLVERELNAIDALIESPEQPVVAILGGVKVADKIGVIEALLDRVDTILIGGAMAYTFMKARGEHVGSSLIEDEKIGVARELMDRFGERLLLPTDHIIADQPNADATIETAVGGIPEDWYGMDFGPQTANDFVSMIEGAATVMWNGPLGKFEDEPFRNGTQTIVEALASCRAKTIVGGGESGQAVEQFGVVNRIDHVSTGGGAFLEYLQYGDLPALDVIDELEPAESRR